jgi:hypothetical protein
MTNVGHVEDVLSRLIDKVRKTKKAALRLFREFKYIEFMLDSEDVLDKYTNVLYAVSTVVISIGIAGFMLELPGLGLAIGLAGMLRTLLLL